MQEPYGESNLVWYLHNMMGYFIQESCDQSRGGRGGYQKDHSLSQEGSKTDHEIFEQPLIKEITLICKLYKIDFF